MGIIQSRNLKGNSIAGIPTELFNLLALHSLIYYALNTIHNITIIYFVCLFADVSHNALIGIKPGLNNLNSLVALNVASNSLANLPQELGNLQSLTSLFDSIPEKHILLICNFSGMSITTSFHSYQN